MVRERIFPILLNSFLLSLFVAVPAHAHGEDVEIIKGKVSKHSIRFGKIPHELFKAKDKQFELRVEFDHKVPTESIKMSLNGHKRCSSDAQFMKEAYWVESKHSATLVMNLGEIRFGNHHRFSSHAHKISKHHGNLKIRVRAPARMRSATLSILKRSPVPSQPRITRVIPRTRVVKQSQIELSFTGEGATGFQCRINEEDFSTCSSPFSIENLTNGKKAFEVRGVGANGATGKSETYTFWVRVPVPPFEFTQIIPNDPITASKSIEIHFTATGVNKNHIYCQLDGGGFQNCQSPVSYQDLADGDHLFEVRGKTLPSWVAKLLKYFPWLATLFPNQAEPATYSWTVDSSSLVATFVTTPENQMAETLAEFSFETNKVANFECVLDGNSMGSCESPLTLNDLQEGIHSLTIQASTEYQTADPINFSWEIDLSAPVLTIDSMNPDQNVTNLDQVEIHFSSSEAATFECSLNGGAAACTSPFVAQGLNDGEQQFAITAKDDVGNISEPQYINWFVDTSKPGVEIQVLKPLQNPTKETAAEFELLANEPLQFECQLNSEPVLACETHIEFNNLPEGSNQFTVTPTDMAGNIGESTTYNWTIDTVAPLITIGQVNPASNPTTEQSIEVSFTVSEPSNITCELNEAGPMACQSPFNASGLADGAHSLVIRATDRAGNMAIQQEYSWTVDTTAHTVISLVSPNSELTSTSSIQFEFSSNTGVSFECSLDSSEFSGCVSPTTYVGLQDGSHQFAVRALNEAGSAGPEQTHAWNIDSTPPSLVASLVHPSSLLTNSNRVEVQFSSNEDASFYCQLDGGAESLCQSPYTTTGLSDGNHTFSVVAADSLGNRTSPQVIQWDIDTNLPSVSFTSINPSGAIANTNSIQASFSSSDASAYYCTLDSSPEQPCQSPLSFNNIPDGNHSVSVVAMDAAGNRSSPAIHSWAIDTQKPILSLTAVLPIGSTTSLNTMEIHFSSSETATYTCSADGTNSTCSSPLLLTNLADGNHTVSITGADSAGNISDPITHSWQISTTPPDVNFIQINPAAAIHNSTSISFIFSAEGAAYFECQLDGLAFETCTSPYTKNGLSAGSHQLSVRAFNTSGSSGAVATHSWSIDLEGPNVFLAALPSHSPTASTSMSLSFSANEPATYSCSIDNAAFSACGSSISQSGFGDGNHSIRVYGTDAYGNDGPVNSYSWTVDSSPITISNYAIHSITQTSAIIEWDTNVPATSQALFGANGALNQTSPTNNTPATHHQVVLTGLARSTFYSAMAVSVDRDGRRVESSTSSFRTLR